MPIKKKPPQSQETNGSRPPFSCFLTFAAFFLFVAVPTLSIMKHSLQLLILFVAALREHNEGLVTRNHRRWCRAVRKVQSVHSGVNSKAVRGIIVIWTDTLLLSI